MRPAAASVRSVFALERAIVGSRIEGTLWSREGDVSITFFGKPGAVWT
jgi:hypothetical protein